MIKLEELKNMAAALNEVRRVDEKKMDKVDKDALKGDFEDRKDKDIDNDGDVDASDQYLHNRRKAVTKAVAKESTELNEGDIVNFSMYAGMYSDGARASFIGRDGDMHTISATGDRPRKYYIDGKEVSWEDAKRIVGKQKLKPKQGMKESTELDEAKDDISKMSDRDLGAMINKLKRQRNRIQNPEAKKKIRIDIEKYEDEEKRRIRKNLDLDEASIEKLTRDRNTVSGPLADRRKEALRAKIKAARDAEEKKIKKSLGIKEAELDEDITKMSHGRLKWHMNTGVPHGSYTNDEMKKERDRRLKNRDSADAYKKAKAGLSENFMEATDAEIRAKQTAGATKPEGIADKESEGSKKFMMMHTTQVPDEVNADEINRMNAEEIKASLQRKVSYRWNDQKIGDK